MEEKIYTVRELAKKLQVKEITIRRYLQKKILNGFKGGKKWYITETNLNTFMESRSNK